MINYTIIQLNIDTPSTLQLYMHPLFWYHLSCLSQYKIAIIIFTWNWPIPFQYKVARESQLNDMVKTADLKQYQIKPNSPGIGSNHDVILRRVAGRAVNPPEIHAQRPAHPGGVHEVVYGGYDLVELVIVCGKTPS